MKDIKTLKYGVVVYWDNETVPFEKQSRQFIGKVHEVASNGCVFLRDTRSQQVRIFYTFEELVKFGTW